MTEPLEASITHLRVLSLHLNEVTDRATAAVRRVETFLNQECRLGVAVYVPVTASAPDAPTLQLGYARGGDRYRIVVRAIAYRLHDGQILRHDGTGSPVVERDEQVAWSECPRAMKLEAFQHLPALLTTLQEQVAAIITRAEAAVAAAQRITAVLGEAPAPDAGATANASADVDRRGEGCDGEGRPDERGRGEDPEHRGHGRHKHGKHDGHGHHGGRGWDRA